MLPALLLFAFWLVLSQRFDPFHITVGILSSVFVAWATRPLYRGTRWESLFSWRFVRYLPWLGVQILLANLQVVKVVLHPRLPIDPDLLRFRTGYRDILTKLILANSITLTPGTITVDVEGDEFLVHALMPASASSLDSMVKRVKEAVP